MATNGWQRAISLSILALAFGWGAGRARAEDASDAFPTSKSLPAQKAGKWGVCYVLVPPGIRKKDAVCRRRNENSCASPGADCVWRPVRRVCESPSMTMCSRNIRSKCNKVQLVPEMPSGIPDYQQYRCDERIGAQAIR